VLLQGLSDNVADNVLLEEVERLAEATDGWSAAADGLEKAIEASKEAEPETTVQICIRLAEWRRDKSGDNPAAERALNTALAADPESDDILVLLEPLQTGEGRERDLIATLRRRAKLQFDEAKREELYRRAKELADAQRDPELAESIIRELLEQDDVNIWALSELTEIREAQEDFKETFALLVKRAELRAAGDLVKELRHRAASIARDKLNQNDRAIELFDLLFEDDPGDTEAAQSLRSLYEAEERFEDMARLLERLVDLAESPEARSALRLELAEMNEKRFGSIDTAVDLLRMILDEEPGHSQAVVKLSHLYEKEQRDEELAELLSRQIESANDRGDTEAELTFRVRLGEVYDSRLGDREKAIQAYRAVLERDARHKGALSALARLYEATEDHEQAVGVLEQLLEMESGDEAVACALALVEQYKKLGDNAGVGRSLERGLAFDERQSELRQQLRAFYESTESWEELAKFIARDADFEDDADNKVALLRRAAEIQGEKRSDHAAEADLLSRASELKPDDRELLLQLCDSYSASGRGKDAVEALQRIVDSYGGRRSKELGEIHRRLANAYLAQGESAKALEELDKAFRIEPGNVGVLKKLGEVAIEVEDYKKAQQMFRALLLQRLDAKSPITKAEVFMRLGQVHAKLDEKSKAIQMLERAVQSDASLDEAKSLLAELKG
jgi:tetratricopeptide (TPR) repeat protein